MTTLEQFLSGTTIRYRGLGRCAHTEYFATFRFDRNFSLYFLDIRRCGSDRPLRQPAMSRDAASGFYLQIVKDNALVS